MRVLCDACESAPAAIFCAADDAALCEKCDKKVHVANPLSSQHTRRALGSPRQSQEHPCDVCKERMGRLYCTACRAVACGECDWQVHSRSGPDQRHLRVPFVNAPMALNASARPDKPVRSVRSEHDQQQGRDPGLEAANPNCASDPSLVRSDSNGQSSLSGLLRVDDQPSLPEEHLLGPSFQQHPEGDLAVPDMCNAPPS